MTQPQDSNESTDPINREKQVNDYDLVPLTHDTIPDGRRVRVWGDGRYPVTPADVLSEIADAADGIDAKIRNDRPESTSCEGYAASLHLYVWVSCEEADEFIERVRDECGGDGRDVLIVSCHQTGDAIDVTRDALPHYIDTDILTVEAAVDALVAGYWFNPHAFDSAISSDDLLNSADDETTESIETVLKYAHPDARRYTHLYLDIWVDATDPYLA